MNSDFDQHVTTIIVDGEDLYVPDPTGWETVRKEHLFRGWPIGVEGLLLQWVEFCSGHPELRVALGKVGKAFDAWIAYVIVSINSRPTRIQLQTVQCPNCKWKGAGGTTAEPDLFVALGPEFHAKYVAAQAVAACLCPRCRQPMPDHIVWCEGSGPR